MAILIGSSTALSTAANTTTASLITGDYEFVGKGRITLIAKGSATGMYVILSVGGALLCNDQPISFTGTAGTVDVVANVMVQQVVAGGRVVLKLRNSTGGALTTDYLLYYDPM